MSHPGPRHRRGADGQSQLDELELLSDESQLDDEDESEVPPHDEGPGSEEMVLSSRRAAGVADEDGVLPGCVRRRSRRGKRLMSSVLLTACPVEPRFEVAQRFRGCSPLPRTPLVVGRASAREEGATRGQEAVRAQHESPRSRDRRRDAGGSCPRRWAMSSWTPTAISTTPRSRWTST